MSDEMVNRNGPSKGEVLPHKQRRGFAAMSPDKRRQIASKGGRTAHELGTAHQWSSDEARAAGKKGGHISRGGRGRVGHL
jgi:hypothetical protein